MVPACRKYGGTSYKPVAGLVKTVLNPHSLEIVTAKVEPALAHATLAERYQFERLAYVALDPKDSQPGKLVFNRTITLKDAWAKEAAKG